jgi:hypothetical protein
MLIFDIAISNDAYHLHRKNAHDAPYSKAYRTHLSPAGEVLLGCRVETRHVAQSVIAAAR